MVQRFVTWSPDTCGCQFMLTYETEEPSPRQFTLKELVKTCPEHAVVANNEQKLTNVFDENKRKTRVHTALRELAESELTTVVQTDDGTTRRVLRENLVSFDFTGTPPNRVLNITINANITAQRKAQLQAAINSRIGAGKVVLL
jgi:hypothetical protein